MVSEPALGRVIDADKLRAGDFYLDKHRAIYETILDLHKESQPVDELTVIHALTQSDRIEVAGGSDYISNLAANVPDPGNVQAYAGHIIECALRREIEAVADEIKGGRLTTDEAMVRLSEIDARQSGGVASARSSLYTLDDLAELPPPRYLVEDFIEEKGFNVLFGPTGGGKSFLALDWSLCVASGLPFYGQKVRQGPVVYIAAEGVSGYYSRAQAWCLSRAVEDVPDFRLYPEAVNFFTDETAAFEAAVRALETPPSLIVIDTMARCLTGGDENSARDVGLFIDNAGQLANKFGSALLTVHHTGKNGEDERGSSALRAACEVTMSLKPEGSGLKLSSIKQKHSADFDPWRFHLEEKAESCVIRLGSDLGRLSSQEEQIIETVSASFGTDWVSASKIIDVSEIPKSSFYRSLKGLVERGSLEERSAGGQRKEYRVPPDSLAVPNLPKPSTGQAETVPSHPPFLRVGRGTDGSGSK